MKPRRLKLTARSISTSLFIASVFAIGACDDPSDTLSVISDAVTTGDIREHIVEDVLLSLDANGHFPPVEPIATGRSMLTREQAANLAERLMRHYGPYVRSELERQHGSKIDFESVRAVGRVFLAESPHKPLSDDVPNPFHKHSGPYYLVSLASDGIPAISVAVSVYATDISIESNGAIQYTGNEGIRGAEFWWNGIPQGSNELILSPEHAVEMVSRMTGVQAAAPPRYIRRGVGYAPTLGYWEVSLAHEIEVVATDDDGPLQTEVIYVDGRMRQVAVAASGYRQPIRISFRGHADPRQVRQVDIDWRERFVSEIVPLQTPNER